MSLLSFCFVAHPEHYLYEARVLVDEVDLLQKVDATMLGLDPVEFFAQSALHSAGKLFIGRCDCGELGCGSISVDVSRSGSQVEWSMPQTPGTIVVFETAQYDKAIQSGATDVSWETVEKTAERMIGQMDFSSCSHLGLTFRWACGQPSLNDVIELQFLRTTAPNNVTFRVRWNRQDPQDAVAAVKELMKEWEETGVAHPTWQSWCFLCSHLTGIKAAGFKADIEFAKSLDK